jgi:hypothetical protein
MRDLANPLLTWAQSARATFQSKNAVGHEQREDDERSAN